MTQPTALLLKTNLKQLKMPTMSSEYEQLAREAAANNEPYESYLLRLTELEVAARSANALAARIKAAAFPVLKDFAATVRSVCETLLAEGALDPSKREPEELRQVVKELLDRVTRAGQQMRAVETVVLRYAQEQRMSANPNETLRRFLIDFHEGEEIDESKLWW